jgi:RNA polymerase sigma-70 factor (ECF subfamily)
MPDSKDDTDLLLKRARGGDAKAVNLLLSRHQAKLHTLVRLRLDRRVSARIDPSDVIQETLVEAHRRLSEYLRHPALPFYPWLRQLACERLGRLHQRHLRAQKRSVKCEEAFEPLMSDESLAMLAKHVAQRGSGPQSRVLQTELRAHVREALARLTPAHREVLVLRHMEQLSVEEISAILGIGQSTVTMRHLRALQKLRAILGK